MSWFSYFNLHFLPKVREAPRNKDMFSKRNCLFLVKNTWPKAPGGGGTLNDKILFESASLLLGTGDWAMGDKTESYKN